MVRQTVSRLLLGGVLALIGGLALGSAPAVASGPDRITVGGEDLAEPLAVTPEEFPDLFTALHSEVSWLIGRPSQAPEPDEEILGPGYELLVHVDGEARYRFELYPLAEGGPRAHRPRDQPGDRRSRPGWFYGRLSMPDTLVSAGVPLPGSELPADPISGGVGGGTTTPEDEAAAAPGVADVLAEWREGLLLTAAVTVAITLGLAASAFFVRRRAS